MFIIVYLKVYYLSLKGKITIIKTLVTPQIHFIYSMIFKTENILQKIDKMLFDFLWNSKPAKIKCTTIIAPISKGGLGMVDSKHDLKKVNTVVWTFA